MIGYDCKCGFMWGYYSGVAPADCKACKKYGTNLYKEPVQPHEYAELKDFTVNQLKVILSKFQGEKVTEQILALMKSEIKIALFNIACHTGEDVFLELEPDLTVYDGRVDVSFKPTTDRAYDFLRDTE